MLANLFSRAAHRVGVMEPESFAQARERYAYICEVLGVREAPPLRLVRRASLLSRAVLADWRPGEFVRMAAAHEIPSDAEFFHEIAHAKAASCMGYRGYHGAPFLALLQLLYAYYWQGPVPNVIEDTVRTHWPRRTKPETRQAEIDTARAAFIAVRERFARLKSPPSADRLARAVAGHFPQRSYVSGNVLDRLGFAELLQTERDGALTVAVWATLALFVLGVFWARYMPSSVASGVAGVTAALAASVVGVIFALESWRRISGRWNTVTARLRRDTEPTGQS